MQKYKSLFEKFNISSIEEGDLVDFGSDGKLYVINTEDYSQFFVTDKKEDRLDADADGWYVSANKVKGIIERADLS